MIRLKNLSIEIKQGLIIAMLVAANCTLFFSLYKLHTFHTQQTNTTYLLERQSTLLQFMANQSSDSASSQQVYEYMTLFHQSLTALQKGGIIEGLGSKIHIQATTDDKLTALLLESRQIWNGIEAQTHKKITPVNVTTQLNNLINYNTQLTEGYIQSFQPVRNAYMALVYGAIALVVISLFLAFNLFRKYIKKPVNSILRTLDGVTAGDLSQQTDYDAQDEIGRLASSVDKMVQNQLYLSDFAEKIGEGQFEIERTELKAGDKLGMSLATMREKLQKVSAEDKKRIWATEGMANFSEILRSANDNIELLSEQIILNLVKYLNVNQGALFILYDDAEQQPYLEVTATYAWNRKKGVTKRIEYGEGLVGQVVRDKDTVYMTDIPDSYVTITSGLGKANPNCLLIVPLKVNAEIHGVIELASFQNIQPFEIEFVEKLSESIAATLSSVKTNEKTRKLLEEARMMNEHMRSQEEEMRQNLEELSSTQEEMQRKEVELTGLFSSINNTLATIEFDLEGYILTANDNFCRMMQYTVDEIKGKHHRIFIDKEEALTKSYKAFWQDLKSGITKIVDVKRYTKTGQEKWINGSYTPVLDKSGNPYKVIKLAYDITEKKLDEIQARRLSLVADNTDNSVIITNKHGLIEFVNQGFTRMTGYTLAEVAGKKPGNFLQGPETNQATVQRIRENILSNQPFSEEVLNYHKDGTAYWISLAINPVFDERGELDKFIAVSANITETKIKNLDFNSKLEAISKSNCVVEFSIDGTITTANDNFLHLMDYTLADIQGKHHSIFVTQEQKNSPEYQDLWNKLHQGEFVSGEFLRISKTGREVWIRGVFNVILDINGKPDKIVKFVQDITAEKLLQLEAKKQAEELREQGEKLRSYTSNLEELQRTLSKKLEDAKGEMKIQIKDLEAEKAKNLAILEGCVDGVIAFNHRGTVEFFNKAAEEIWQLSRNEVLRRSITLLMPVTFEERENKFSKVIFSEGSLKKELGIRTEVSFTDKFGEEISVLVTLTQANIGSEHTYTLFVQKISVELF
jgi:PAS domain S-box-containing protein